MEKLVDKRFSLWIALCCNLTLLLSFPDRSLGQYAKVKHIVAKTSEGVSVSVWVDHQTFRFGQDVVVKYKVDNFSPKTIYLVHEKKLDFVAKNGTISIGSPDPFPIGHGGFDYSFTKIIKGKSYRGDSAGR